MRGLVRWVPDFIAYRIWRIRLFGMQLRRGLGRWLDPLAGSDEVRYRTLDQIALERIAEEFDDPSSEFYIPPWEVPHEDDLPPVELPLELRAREQQFLADIDGHIASVETKRRRRRRLRRRRVTAFASGVLLAVAGVGVGASAVLTGSTGSDAVDAFLNLADAHSGRRPLSSATGPSAYIDIRPKLDSASQPLPVPLGSRQAESVAYLSNDGRVCFAASTAPPREQLARVVGVMGCVSPAILKRRLVADTAFILGFVSGRATILSGYAASSVEALRIVGPQGQLHVQLGKSWRPEVPGAVSVRPFVAVGAMGKRFNLAQERQAHDPTNYAIEAELANGETIRAGD